MTENDDEIALSSGQSSPQYPPKSEKMEPTEAPALSRPLPPVAPLANVGVLIVHGIGDQGEGETLTRFGEPLIDWLREWLGPHGEPPIGRVEVTECQLRARRTADVSPAFARVDVTLVNVPTTALPLDHPGRESWLFCEAWWGGTVLPPDHRAMVRWVLTRAPLVIFWHFLGGATAPTGKQLTMQPQRALALMLVALISFLVQGVLAVALAMMILPIGRWRRAVVKATRVLTLFVGDSLVLLERDFQRAALVERVLETLNWLEQRVDRIAVVAHSQGAAVAHAALQQSSSERIRSFITLGSGLEKLAFLAEVRLSRKGLISASLLGACSWGGVLLVGYATALSWNPWRVNLTLPIAAQNAFILGFPVLCIAVMAAKELAQRVTEVYRAPLDPQRFDLRKQLVNAHWLDLYSSCDLVPMQRHALLEGQPFVTRQQVINRRSLLSDHNSYLQTPTDAGWRIWRELAGLSELNLMQGSEAEQHLLSAAKAHANRTRLRICITWTTVVAGITLTGALLLGMPPALESTGNRWLAAVQTVPAFSDLGVGLSKWVAPFAPTAVAGGWLALVASVLVLMLYLKVALDVWDQGTRQSFTACCLQKSRTLSASASLRTKAVTFAPGVIALGPPVLLLWAMFDASPIDRLVWFGVVALAVCEAAFALCLATFGPWLLGSKHRKGILNDSVPTSFVRVVLWLFVPLASLGFSYGAMLLISPASIPNLYPIAIVLLLGIWGVSQVVAWLWDRHKKQGAGA